MASEPRFVFPGDPIDPAFIPSHKTKALRLGPGLRHVPPATIAPTVAGQLMADHKKNSIWVEYSSGKVNVMLYLHPVSSRPASAPATRPRSSIKNYAANRSQISASIPQRPATS